MKVSELSVEQLKALVQEAVEEKLWEILGDPDQGLTLRADVVEKLKHSLATVEYEKKMIPAEQVAEKTKLKWE
jgi:hypothetical protein